MLAAVLALLLGASQPAQGGDVRGRIVDGSTNEPVAGAYVTLVGEAVAREARTGAAGDYSFTDLTPGVYRIQVAHPGYASAGVSVMVREGSEVVVDIPLDLRPIEFRPIQVAAAREKATGAMPTVEDSVELSLRAQRPGGLGPQGTSALADMVAGGVKRDMPNPDGSRNAHVLY